MQLGNPRIISKSQRERLIMTNYCIHGAVRLFGTENLNKNILSQHFFKRKIKEKIFEFEEEQLLLNR